MIVPVAILLTAAACHTPADWNALPTGAAVVPARATVALPTPRRPSDVDAYALPGRCSLPAAVVRWRAGKLHNTSRRPVVAFYWLETD